MAETFYRVNTGFTNLNAENLLFKGKTVLTAMTANVATFATPSPALTVLSGNIDDLEWAINKYNTAGGGEVLLSQRNDAMAPLVKTLIQLGTYVQTISKGDKTIIMSAGFDAEKDKTIVGELSAPENFNVDSQRGGKVVLSWKLVKGSNSYIVEWTSAPVTDSSKWTPETSTKTKKSLSGFTPGLHLAFRVRAVGANPVKNYSVIIYDYTR